MICTMKHRNIRTSSSPQKPSAACRSKRTASLRFVFFVIAGIRRANRSRISGKCTAAFWLLDGVDLLDGALRPVFAVFVDVLLLRKAAERGDVRRVHFLAFLLEVLESINLR